MRYLVLLLSLACATSGPSAVFDDYFEAYGAGDAGRLWELSSPAARNDARRIRTELLAHLESERVEERVEFEGLFGITAEDVRPLDDQQFFEWAVGTIRRRLGVTAIRALVSRVQRVREEPVNAELVVVIYRVGEELSRLPLLKTPDGWRVDQSPFPQPQPAEVTPSGGGDR